MAGDLLPYFKVFPAETLADERFSGWTVAERGAWFSLLLHAWVNGSIPSDEVAIARILHLDATALRSLWPAIEDRFIPHPDLPGRLTSRRLEMEREEAMARSEAGKAGAKSRWTQKNRRRAAPDAAAERPQCDRNAEPMPAAQRRSAQRSAEAEPAHAEDPSGGTTGPAARPTPPGADASEVAAPVRLMGLDRLRAAWDEEHPVAAGLLTALSAGGLRLSPPRQAEVTGQVERAAISLGVEMATQVVLEAHADDPNPSLGWYAKALHRAAEQAKAAPTPPSGSNPGAREGVVYQE